MYTYQWPQAATATCEIIDTNVNILLLPFVWNTLPIAHVQNRPCLTLVSAMQMQPPKRECILDLIQACLA